MPYKEMPDLVSVAELNCGCEILSLPAGYGEYFDIEFCQKHAAAPDLLAACKLALQYAKDFMPNLTDDAGWEQHQALVNALDSAIDWEPSAPVSTSRQYPE